MHIGDTPEEAAFRAEARTWLEAHAHRRDSHVGKSADHTRDLAGHMQACRDWQRVLYDNNWAGITWPKQYGGRGASAIQSAIFAEEMSQFDVATGAFAVSIGMVGPTLITHGTPEQQQHHLAPILKGEEVWCQLFSEPGSGSDLASLGTRAVRDGDDWIVNGQKVWTSFGQFADYAILLARTDVDLPKHAGITYFILDMKSPGIDVRPITQITGVQHFNETFLTDVRIPHTNIIGEINAGWKGAQTTLMNERSHIGSGGTWSVDQLIQLAQQRGLSSDLNVRQGLAQAHTRAETLRYMGFRMRTAMSQMRMPGPEALTLKLAYANHWILTAELATEILGAGAMLWADDAPEDNQWGQHLLGQFAIRIGGGTDEIQHNIIAERGLGLPREPQLDKDTPWRVSNKVG
ncbi:MAG: acyl-CoA dehydrogenase family protein [Actinomycetota bacterium]|nr:acyl-CoA dehydrogenase family protein [Actinomycetota bacterium]MDA3018810.1 acyl-CoA dehydrogenase family protein [Actinomycetota bacterium]